MYNVKLYNKISKVGLDDLDPAKYTCSEDFTDYDAVLVRSAKLHDVEFPKNLRCIARAGAGVNNIPIDRCSDALWPPSFSCSTSVNSQRTGGLLP